MWETPSSGRRSQRPRQDTAACGAGVEEGGVAPVPPVPLAASTSAWPLQTAWSPRALPQAANPAFLSEDHRASFCPLQGWFDSGPRVCGFLRMMARAVIPGDSLGRRGFRVPGYNARLHS